MSPVDCPLRQLCKRDVTEEYHSNVCAGGTYRSWSACGTYMSTLEHRKPKDWPL